MELGLTEFVPPTLPDRNKNVGKDGAPTVVSLDRRPRLAARTWGTRICGQARIPYLKIEKWRTASFLRLGGLGDGLGLDGDGALAGFPVGFCAHDWRGAMCRLGSGKQRFWDFVDSDCSFGELNEEALGVEGWG